MAVSFRGRYTANETRPVVQHLDHQRAPEFSNLPLSEVDKIGHTAMLLRRVNDQARYDIPALPPPRPAVVTLDRRAGPHGGRVMFERLETRP